MDTFPTHSLLLLLLLLLCTVGTIQGWSFGAPGPLSELPAPQPSDAANPDNRTRKLENLKCSAISASHKLILLFPSPALTSPPPCPPSPPLLLFLLLLLLHYLFLLLLLIHSPPFHFLLQLLLLLLQFILPSSSNASVDCGHSGASTGLSCHLATRAQYCESRHQQLSLCAAILLSQSSAHATQRWQRAAGHTHSEQRRFGELTSICSSCSSGSSKTSFS